MAGVATMARSMKFPTQVVEIGKALLKYVDATSEEGLNYHKASGWGARDHLSVKRHDRLLEVFSDISYGTAGDHKSVQGILGDDEATIRCAVHCGGGPDKVL